MAIDRNKLGTSVRGKCSSLVWKFTIYCVIDHKVTTRQVKSRPLDPLLPYAPT